MLPRAAGSLQRPLPRNATGSIGLRPADFTVDGRTGGPRRDTLRADLVPYAALEPRPAAGERLRDADAVVAIERIVYGEVDLRDADGGPFLHRPTAMSLLLGDPYAGGGHGPERGGLVDTYV